MTSTETVSLRAGTAAKLLPKAERDAWIDSLSEADAVALLYQWRKFWARDNQLAPPGDWATWIVLAGRGVGKTRTGAEFVREEVEAGRAKRIALIGATAADVRDVMIEGPSGLLSCYPEWDRPIYEPSKRRVVWPSCGAIATAYSAEEPDRLRGPQHDLGWADEVAAWRYDEAWDMFSFGLRQGMWPRAIATTTPKPVKLVREILADPMTVKSGGSTMENAANLAPVFLKRVIAKYAGTRLGRQELDAEMLEDVPGALWTLATIEKTRRTVEQLLGNDAEKLKADDADRIKLIRATMKRIVVAIDPSGTKGSTRDEESKSNDVGIVVAGKGYDDHGYVLQDLTCNLAPAEWGKRAVDAYDAWGADRIVAESNFGGAMVESVIRAVRQDVSYRAVVASRGKAVRAEPVAALYDQDRCHNLGTFGELESQMVMMTSEGYQGGRGSPDRLDATVWAFIELMIERRELPKASVTRATVGRRR